MSNAKAAMEKMEVMINGVKRLVDTLQSEAAAQKEANDRMEARLSALEKLFQKEKPKAAKEEPKKAKKTKASAKTEEESESEEKKAKREVKPSAKSDAWRALCDAVRAVHKKDAMKIAKILKDGGNLEPTKEDIEAAAAELPQKESTPTQSDAEKPAKSGSESDGSSAAKKRGRPKKTASE